MTNEEIKVALLKEHARDKRLTITAYSLLLAVAIVVVVFLGGFILSMVDTAPAYPKIVLVVALAMYAFYGISKIVKLTRKHRQIEDLLDLVASGSKATSIVEHTEYKIIIPALKITFRLCPVVYHRFSLDTNPAKMYSIAVHPYFSTDFKTFLSGNSLESINEKISSIYSDESEASVSDADNSIELKTVEEFRAFLGDEMGEDVQALEKTRKSSRQAKTVMSIFSIILTASFMGYMFYGYTTTEGGLTGPALYIPIVIFFGVFYLGYMLYFVPRAKKGTLDVSAIGGGADFDFKTKIVSKVINFVDPRIEYVMHGHISHEEFLESGLFRRANYKINGSDLIIGRYHGVPFQLSDITAAINKKITKENEEPEYAFYGQLFIARFNKTFSHPLHVVPKSGVKEFFSDSYRDVYAETEGEKIQLEDPEFMKMFNVYGGDQIEARYILSTSLMERIKELTKRSEAPVMISFTNNTVSIALNSNRSNFEFKLNKSLTKNENKIIVEFYEQLCSQLSIIDELKLNVKIWK